MPWFRISGVSGLIAAVSLLIVYLHGHLICADELTGTLIVLFLISGLCSIASFLAAVIKRIAESRRTKNNDGTAVG
jgi:hypothetical protein